MRYAHGCSAGNIADANLSANASPHQRIKAFARVMLAGLLDSGKPAWHGKLMAREMADPTPAVLQQIAEEGVKPRLRLLSEIVRSVIGPDAPEKQVFRCVRSIVGQILFYHFARPMLARVFPDETLDASAVETLAEHIATFSLGGLRELAAANAASNVAATNAAKKEDALR